jgi:hypothetical protein
MKKLERLRKEALKCCTFRGHQMKPSIHLTKNSWWSECKMCGKTVVVTDNPAPNDIELGGEALALGCKD